MNRQTTALTFGTLVIISVGAAFWLGQNNRQEPEKITVKIPVTSSPLPPRQIQTVPLTTSPSPTISKLPKMKRHGPGSIIEDEVVLQFKDRASLNEALQILTEAGVPLRGSIGPLGLLRVQLPPGGIRQINDLLGDRIIDRATNVRVALPEPIALPTDGSVLKAFGSDWIAMLGAPADISDWGKGVRIAVIDAGVTSHPALDGARIDRYSLVDEVVANGHGNAVTSLIVGNGDPGQPKGLAPAAEILAYQAMGEVNGNAFTIAQAIVDAVDHGANIINLSLGGWGDNTAVRSAVEYASQSGVVIVAAVGNDRLDQITYPAAYPEVIAVTAVDAGFHWAEYPNAGLDGAWPNIAAPGVGLPAAYSDDQNIAFSGTSAAAPVVSAAIAAYMSVTGASAQESAAIVISQASDRGEPGADPFLGDGILDLARIMRVNQPGIIDLAVTDNYVDASLATKAGLPVRIGVQNRGTEIVNSPILTIMIGTRDNVSQIQLGPLAPGQVTEFDTMIPVEYFQKNSPAAIGAVISTREAKDINPENNAIASAYGVTLDTNGEPILSEARAK